MLLWLSKTITVRISILLAIVLTILIAGTIYVINLMERETPGAKFEPPDGYAYTGMDANQLPGDTRQDALTKWNGWTNLTGGKSATISHTFEGFDTWFGYDFEIAKAREATPLITWQTNSISPQTIAQAGNTPQDKPTDQLIVQNAQLSAQYSEPCLLYTSPSPRDS